MTWMTPTCELALCAHRQSRTNVSSFAYCRLIFFHKRREAARIYKQENTKRDAKVRSACSIILGQQRLTRVYDRTARLSVRIKLAVVLATRITWLCNDVAPTRELLNGTSHLAHDKCSTHAALQDLNLLQTEQFPSSPYYILFYNALSNKRCQRQPIKHQRFVHKINQPYRIL